MFKEWIDNDIREGKSICYKKVGGKKNGDVQYSMEYDCHHSGKLRQTGKGERIGTDSYLIDGRCPSQVVCNLLFITELKCIPLLLRPNFQ